MNEFIVAEITKNWTAGKPDTPGLLCHAFEKVIETNRRRDYILHTFTMNQLLTGSNTMLETIVAVFRRKGGGE